MLRKLASDKYDRDGLVTILMDTKTDGKHNSRENVAATGICIKKYIHELVYYK